MSTGLLESRDEYLLANFERALGEGWIEIYSQPVIRASTGRVCEEELFARWDDPVLGILNPGDFIPTLESSGVVERLDLHILEKALGKIRKQAEIGVDIAVTSINFSLSDFQNEDFVNEVEGRVLASGVSRGKLAFELSESAALVENHVIAAQLAKLKELGYRLEIDDFGYDFIPLLLSPSISFDALKLNMALIRHLPGNQRAAVIVEELLKMSAKLGVDVIAKGVESREQVDFLCEIGCGKLQGFYYSRPMSAASLFDYARSNRQFLEVESTEEEAYYSQVDKINIHELTYVRENDGGSGSNDGENPVAILEIDDDEIRVIRINDACNRFISENFPGKEGILSASISSQLDSSGSYVLSTIGKCVHSDERFVIEERTPSGKTVHLLIQKIAENPATSCRAVLFAVISVDAPSKHSASLSYDYISWALSEDYIAMYVVDIETDNYVEYHTDGLNRNVTVEKTGEDFFYDARHDVEGKTYHEDRELFNELCTKENILKQIDERGAFSITYRAEDEAGIRYVNFKAVSDGGSDKRIIIGVSSVDSQVKLRQAFDSLQEERTTFSRIAALAGNFFAIYVINPEDNSYTVHKTVEGEGFIGGNKGGEDFFAETQERIKGLIHPDDLQGFRENIRKEVVQEKIAADGFFEHRYRLIIGGKPTYFMQKGVVVTENDEQKLVIGLMNIDAQIRKDEEYAENLSAAEGLALRDGLTGVKNKHAYALAERELADSLKSGKVREFAIAVFDLNDLKYVNDNFGHKKGDEYIKTGCKMICETFAHSPVYRIGGDEFTVIAQGNDYERLDYLMGVIEKRNNENMLRGEATIAAGMALGTERSVITDVFMQADADMYEKKRRMKAAGPH